MSVPFHRTPQGLSNQALFAKVDVVVFAEGGGIRIIEDIEKGAGDLTTLDCAFWSAIFRSALPERKIEVRSVGHKPTVQAIAELVAVGAVTRVVAALDRDFDHCKDLTISHCNVFYTCGYSWENDVFCEEVLIDVFRELALPTAILSKAHDALRTAGIELRRSFSKIVRVDQALAIMGQQVTVREELKRSIQIHEQNAPGINRSIIAKELRRCRSLGTRHSWATSHGSVEKDLYGHAIAKWWLGQVHHFLRTNVSLKMSNEVVSRLAISTYAKRIEGNSQHYYRKIADGLVW